MRHNLRSFPRFVQAATMCALVAALGCKDLTGSQQLPAGTVDPGTYNTLESALGMRNAALAAALDAVPAFVLSSGLLTDELQVNTIGARGAILNSPGALTMQTQIDERIIPASSVGCGYGGTVSYAYCQAQEIRAFSQQARGALAAYAADTLVALRGELHAMEGYGDIMLADLFCSGVPLSTLDYGHDFTYHAGSTTAQVYRAAVAHLDSALALSGDSVRALNLARVLKGRALLALAEYDNAAAAVHDVPTDFRYQLAFTWTRPLIDQQNELTAIATVSDREGNVGLPFRSSDDPRTRVTQVDTNIYGVPLYFPAKYHTSGYDQFTFASGIEARLIEAEADLRAGRSSWLTTLNALRTPCLTTGGCATPAPAGTGGIAGLPPLDDPGAGPLPVGTTALQARLDLLLQERASWLFLTAHRQGDLRRLVRNDHQPSDRLYPNGTYVPLGQGRYGNDVTLGISVDEQRNSLFRGCLDRDA